MVRYEHLPEAAGAVHRDREIVKKLKARDWSAAFESLADRYEVNIYRLCCAILKDRDLAEDTAQESLIRIWRNLDRFDCDASLSSWIFAVTRNRCLTAFNRRRDAAARATLNMPVPFEMEFASTAEAADNVDQVGILRELVESLPEKYRRTVTLYYYEDRSVTQVAELLAVPQGTVKTHLCRARAILFERIKEMGLSDRTLWVRDSA